MIKKMFLLIAMLLPVVAMAAEKDGNITVPAGESNLRLAAQLSKYGYAHNDALSLIQAARLSKQAGYVAEERAKEKTEGGTASEAKGNGQVSLDVAKLLTDAKAMAVNDGVLLALIDDVNNNTRGAYGGPKYAVSSVAAHGTDYYTIKFRADEDAYVMVIGDGDTDLDLYVYDENGNLIDSDTDYTDDCLCAFHPRWTGNFRIKIVNRGSVYNRYVLRTN